MGCPEGWLDWDAYSVLIQASSLSLAINLAASFCSAEAEMPQKPHYVELSHNKDKVLTDT